MDFHLSNFLRRSRQPAHRAAAQQLDVKAIIAGVEKASSHPEVRGLVERFGPEELSAIQASASASAARAIASLSASRAAAAAAQTSAPRQGANPATLGTSISRVSVTQAVGAPASVVHSASSTSSSRPVSSSSTIMSSSTIKSSSVVPTTSSPQVLTITSVSTTTSSASTSSVAPSASAAAASPSSETKGMSTGSIVGIALAAIVGVVVIGSAIGWLYRKYATRQYSTKSPWSKLDDNDVTPFPPREKPHAERPAPDVNDDIYGNSPAPVIGSRRALALARNNAFNADGTFRPNSDYVENNRAGYGAGGGGGTYGAFSNMVPRDGRQMGYGMDPQGRAYNGHAGRAPIQPQAYGNGYGPSGPAGPGAPYYGNTRQLIGANVHAPPYPYPSAPTANPMNHMQNLAPVQMGKPLPPTSDADLMQHEEFMDLPKTSPAPSSSTEPNNTYSAYGLAYAESEPDYAPQSAATTSDWSGHAAGQTMTMPVAKPASTQHTPLPALVPMSPLMSSFDLAKRQSGQALVTAKRQSQPLGPLAADFASKYAGSQPLAMYADESPSHHQKRLYGEVATAAGVDEPKTPHSVLNASTTSSTTVDTESSFSAHGHTIQRLPAATMPVQKMTLPMLNLIPPQPYQHGQPLSPLAEMPTPASSTMPLPSGSIPHGQEQNPFDRMEASNTNTRSLLTSKGLAQPRPPHSAASTSTVYPSPGFPPPSPGGMSVPGSVGGSPTNGAKRVSVFDEEDAYGGI